MRIIGNFRNADKLMGQQLRELARNALLSAANEYAGKALGGVSGGTGGGGSTPNYFGRRFTSSNNHGFTALSDKPRFVVVKRRADGKWLGFMADGYATAKRKKFGNKPILVASGQMLRDLRNGVRVSLEGDRAIATFTLSKIAEYHFTGTKNMPKRDPVMPDDNDRTAFRARAGVIYRQLIQRWRAAR
jgi:hypothetical protein